MFDASERQFGDGPDTGRRVDEDCEYGAIAEADLGISAEENSMTMLLLSEALGVFEGHAQSTQP